MHKPNRAGGDDCGAVLLDRTRSAVLLDVDGQPVGFATEDLDLSRAHSESIRRNDVLYSILQRARSVLAANPDGPFPLTIKSGRKRDVYLYRLFSTRSDASLHVLLLGPGELDSERASESDQVAVVNRDLQVLWSNLADGHRSQGPPPDVFCHDVWDPKDPPHCPVATCLATGLPSRAEVEIDDVPWVVRAYPIRTTSEDEDEQEPIAALRVGRPLSQILRAPAALFSVDPEGKINTWNSTALSFSLYGSDELFGKHLWIAVGVPELRDLLARVRQDGDEGTVRRVIEPTGNGAERLGIEIMAIDNRESSHIVALWDIPRVSENYEDWHRNVIENASDLIYRYRIAPEEKFEYVSPSAIDLLGYSQEELISEMTLEDLVAPEDQSVVREILTGKFNPSHPFVMRWKCRDGKIIWTEQNLTPLHRGFAHKAVVFDGIARDVTRRVEMERELHYLSFHDSLTGLYNRAYFNEELARLESGRADPVSFISTDMDYLKLINDTLGHGEGDEVLRAFADVLSNTFRGSDVVARIGGDEFAVILARTDSDTVDELTQRLRNNLQKHNRRYSELPLSVSIGRSTRSPGEKLEETLNRADRDMYRVKLRHSDSSVMSLIQYLLFLLWKKEGIDNEYVNWLTSLAASVGERLNLPREEINGLRELTRVYDLGKVAIDDEILKKGGPLSDKEWEQMKDHSVIGHRVALSVPHLSHMASLILHHHEWWDGSGYPRGLGQREIPLASRILAVVDAYGAMLRGRPYQEPMSPEEALEELKKGAGSQFDPRVVEVMVDLLSSAEDPS